MPSIIARESYLEAYFKFLYYNCLIPFKPVWKSDGNLLAFQGNGMQKILCIVVNLLVLIDIIYNLLTFQGTLRSSPVVLFNYAGIVLGFFDSFTWNNCFWRKQTQFTKLLYETSTYCWLPQNVFFKIKKIALLVSPAFLAVLAYLSEINVGNGHLHLPYHTDKTLLFTMEFKWLNFLLLLRQIPLCFSVYIGACFDILTITIAFSVYDFTNGRLKNVKTSVSKQVIPGAANNKPIIKNMVNVAKEIQSYFRNLNDFYSNLFFFWFCTVFPWIPLQILRISSVEEYQIIDIIRVVYTLLCTSFYVTTGILFSESRKRVIQFRTDAIEYLLEDPYNTDTKQNLVKYFEVTLEDAVIKGGNYVRISYEFLGSVVSALIGYGFLVLQLRSSISVSLPNSILSESVDLEQ